jgi:cytoskeletal protein CcmA (bactofilin family)
MWGTTSKKRRFAMKDSGAIQTFLGPETTLEGKLAFEGTVRLDGHFTGTIESREGVVVIGDQAVIRADILVHTATVSGEVSGNIRAADRIELQPPARVTGDLKAPVIVIESGVVFRGNCTMEPRDHSADKTINLAEWQN